MTSTVTFELWSLAQMALKNLTKLTRSQLEKDADRLGVPWVLGTVGTYTSLCHWLSPIHCQSPAKGLV